MWSPDRKLLYFPPRYGVWEDVVRGEACVVIRTGPPLTQPGHDAGVTKPVTTGGLVRIPLTQEADGALQPRVQGLHKLEVMPPLVIMSLPPL